jgi:hypothetical protein
LNRGGQGTSMLNLRKTLKIDIIFGRAITALESGASGELI